jgi:hypothetical protein
MDFLTSLRGESGIFLGKGHWGVAEYVGSWLVCTVVSLKYVHESNIVDN